MSKDAKDPNLESLRDAVKNDPSDWEARKSLAHRLYDSGEFGDAAHVIWDAEEIPSVDLELAFAARVLAKAAPRKSIRLLTALLEHNKGKAVQNLGLANALMHHGMVLQAARFYGAALEADPSFANPELEHFILWTDDEESLWGDFKNRKPKLGELPWMKRDPKEAMKLTSKVSHHTSPVKVPNLEPAAGEELENDMYQQEAKKGADPSPPPAVTIPVDRVDPKHRRFDSEMGAPDAGKAKKAETSEPAESPKPEAEVAEEEPKSLPKPAVAKQEPEPEKSKTPTLGAPPAAGNPPPPTIKLNPPKTVPPPAKPGAPATKKLNFGPPKEASTPRAAITVDKDES
ncbi:hypothetical protein HAHE_14310 [Haloferula helveola]|uniref:Tetratricopeptide repeat protein n=1 Tax=Haloferula helveola TaxID=490095 RepID=A0ABM7RDS0_9BACT|nr:hypothetical protein HAHE_14310 [Haloferula helveola]